jgi:hypothetical protein
VTEKKAPVKRKKKVDVTPETSTEVAVVAKKHIGTSFALTQLYYEIDTVKLQMDMFSDEDLYDYCLHHIEMYKHKELDRLYPKLAQGKKLDKIERRALEAFCILANTELGLEV